MIQKELKDFIEQHCSGVEPSEIIMNAIENKIVELGADGEEVLAFVEKCSNGPTLVEKQAEAKRQAEREADRQTRIEEAKHKAISDAKVAEIASSNALTAMANAETKRAEADTLKEKRHQQVVDDAKRKSKRRTYIVAIIVILLLGGACATAYFKIMTGKSMAKLASEAAYNQINSEHIDDIEVSTEDVPSDDPSIVIDANGDVKAQLETHYDMVYNLNAGFYKLKLNNLYGLADKSGKIIQKPKFDEIGNKNNLGLIKIVKDGKMGFLNLKGTIVVEPKYDTIEEPKDGMMKVSNNKLYGFLNANTLQEVTPCCYTYIYSLQDNKFKVTNGSKIGYLNADGSVNQEPR